jgi:hypothetical protein
VDAGLSLQSHDVKVDVSNLRGILSFDLTQLGPSLLGRPATVVQKRASS